METQTAMQTVTHTVTATTCPSGKKIYITQEAAENFSKYLQEKYPDQMKQYAYACERCPNFHLSAMPPEARELAKNHPGSSLNVLVPPPSFCGKGKRPISEMMDREQFITDERTKNPSISNQELITKVAGRYNIQQLSAANWLAKFDAKRSPTSSTGSTRFPLSLTVESLDSQEAALEAQLQALKAKKA